MLNEIQNSFPTLQFTALARSDIEDTWYYLGEFGDDIAENIIRQIMEKCIVLSKNPKLGRERNDLILNMRQFPFRNFNIYYFTTDFGVEIYRVLHSSRDNVQVFGETTD